jgi:peptide/nickel transport system substrate-binding protein
MWSILSNLKKSVVLAPVAIILMLAMGCGTAEPAPTAVPASEIASMVREAVQESVPAPAEAGPSAAEIQQLIEAAVSNAPAGVTAAEVQKLVEAAVSNAPTGVTAAEVQRAVESSVQQAAAGQLTAAQVQTIVDASIRALPAPQVDTGQLRGLVQAAVQDSVPKGTSAEEIQRMVEAAVTGATAGGVTRGDMETLITKSVSDVAAGQLSTSDVEKIVAASLSATERAIEATEKAVAEAGMAAMAAQKAAEKAVEEAQMAAAAAVPASTCYVIGTAVDDCPSVSVRTWQAPITPPGSFPSYLYEGPRPTQFQESPMSYQLVKQGKIPPVEERLPVPEDVMVLNVMNEIGQYGGMWRITQTGNVIGDLDDKADCMYREPNEVDSIPEICKSFQVSPDGTVWTFELRRGAKWSDGEPMTMEDVQFAWNELNFNKEFNPTIQPQYRDAITDNEVSFNVVDDTTFTLTFDTPSFTLTDGKSQRGYWGSGNGRFSWYAPKHFLAEFHPDHSTAAKITEHLGRYQQEAWTGLMRKVTNPRDPDIGIKGPSLNAWYHESILDTQGFDSRNHFFVGVDPEGNQLPYIDRRTSVRTEDRPAAVLRTLAGETDQNSCLSSIPELPLYVTNMEKGDYSLFHWPTPGGNDGTVSLNHTYNTDPEIGKLLRTKDFRRALSMGFERDKINENAFLGLGTPQTWVPHPRTPYYPGEELANFEIQFDPAEATRILDDLGLTDTDGDGIRNRADGENISFYLGIGSDQVSTSIAEFVKQYWGDIGIELNFDVDSNWFRNIRDNGTSYFGIVADYSPYQHNPWNVSWTNLAPLQPRLNFPEIGRWYQTSGEKGMAPGADPSYMPVAPAGNFPADPSGNIMKLENLWQQGRNFSMYSPDRLRIGKEIFGLHATEKFDIPMIGFTGVRRGIAVVRNNFRNVPQTHVRDCWGFWRETYYFEDGVDNFHHPGNKSKRYTSTTFFGG